MASAASLYCSTTAARSLAGIESVAAICVGPAAAMPRDVARADDELLLDGGGSVHGVPVRVVGAVVSVTGIPRSRPAGWSELVGDGLQAILAGDWPSRCRKRAGALGRA